MKSKLLMPLAVPLLMGGLNTNAQSPIRQPAEKSVSVPQNKNPEITDKQLQQLTIGVIRNEDWKNDSLLPKIKIVSLSKPAPSDPVETKFYHMVKKLNQKLQSPITDIILDSSGSYPEDAIASIAGNRQFIYIPLNNYSQPSDIEDQINKIKISHEMGHLKHHDNKDIFHGIEAVVREAYKYSLFLEWIDKGLGKDDPQKEILAKIHSHFMNELFTPGSTILRVYYQGDVKKYENFVNNIKNQYSGATSPSREEAIHLIDSVAKKSAQASFAQSISELHADKSAMIATRDPKGFEKYLGLTYAKDYNQAIADSNEVLKQQGRDTLAFLTPRQAFDSADAVMFEKYKAGVLSHPFNKERVDISKQWARKKHLTDDWTPEDDRLVKRWFEDQKKKNSEFRQK